MRIVNISLLKAGCRENYWFFTVADVAFKTARMPYEYLVLDTPCERYIRNPVNYDRLHMWRAEFFVHQNHHQQRWAESNFTQHAKRGMVIGHDHSSLFWYVWIMHETKFIKSSQIAFETQDKILEIMGELKAVEMSDSEGVM